MLNRLRLLASKPVRIVILMLAIGFIGLRWWQSRREAPGALWDRAVEANKTGDHATAELLLRKLIAAQPNNAEARVALADLYTATAPRSKRAKLETTTPRVLEQLTEAARLVPENVGLQLRLMRALFDSNKLKPATEAARIAVERGTDDRLALYLAALTALEDDDKAFLDDIVAKIRTDRVVPNFRIGLLLARVYQTTTETELLSLLIDGAFQHAVRMQTLQLEALSADEIEALRDLVIVAVEVSPNLTEAQVRTGQAFTILERMDTMEKKADVAQHVADTAARVALVLLDRFPLGPSATADDKQTRDALHKQARDIIRPALEADATPASVYHAEARLLLLAGNETAALQILERGVSALDALPAAERGEIAKLRMLTAQQLLLKQNFAEADRHVQSLRKHPETVGHAELLAGTIAINERRFEDAVTALKLARVKLGDTIPVLTGLAIAQLNARQWSDALDLLRLIYDRLDKSPDEERILARRYFHTREQVLLAEAAALLALGQTDDSFALVKRLENTPFALQAQLMKISYHRLHGERTEAWQALRAARAKAPQDFSLVAEEVQLLQSEKSVREAEIVLADYARQHPQHLESQLAVAQWRLTHDAPDAAVQWLSQLTIRFPKESAPRILLADAHLTANNVDAADKLIAELKKDPTAQAAATRLEARAALLRQGLREAADILARAGSAAKRDGRLQYWQGEMAGAQGHHAEAMSIYSRLAPYSDLRDAATQRILISLAALARQQTPAEAEHQLEAILKDQPNDRLLLLAAVELAARQQKFTQASAHLDRLARLQPKDADVPFLRAQLFVRKGDTDAALTQIQQALTLNPQHLASRLLAARLFTQRNEPLAAMEHVEYIIEQKPGTAEAYVLEAWSLFQLNRRDEAVTVLRDRIREQPDQPVTYPALAAMLRQMNQTDEAIRALRQGWERMPTNRGLFEPLVLTLCETGKVDEAFSLARRFGGDRPDLKSTVYLTELFVRGKAYESARKLSLYALRLSKGPATVTVRMLVAEICLHLSQAKGDKSLLPEAREHYTAVMQEQPQNLVAANNLAWLLAEELNEPQEALLLVRKVRDQIPDERLPVSMIDTFILVYRKLGLMNEALLLTEAALAKHPEAALVHYQAGFVYAELGKPDQAMTSLDKALQLGLSTDRTTAARAQRERLVKD
jgi:tetratricopeptide (TPR) repeat protein